MSTAETPTSIVEHKTPTPAALSVSASPMELVMSRLRVMWCNVPFTTPEAKALLLSITATPTILETDRFGRMFGIVAALVQHPSEFINENGEVFSAPVTTLLTADGDTFRWASAGVADCLAVLTMDRPAGLWSPPVWVKCVGLKTAKGWTRMTLQPATDPNPAATVKGVKNGR